MKRLFSVLLIALLLVFPVLTAQADGGQYVYLDEELGILFTDDDLSPLLYRGFCGGTRR